MIRRYLAFVKQTTRQVFTTGCPLGDTKTPSLGDLVSWW